jgi:hypothetical protein
VRLAVVRLAIVVLACVACKMPVAHLPVGTRVPMDELQRHRSELARFIAGELAAGNHARAFYALELEKTRPYSQQALAARDRASDRIATTDLRPVFLAFADTESGSHERGLALVASSRVAAERDGDDVAFWKHMRLFEQRTSPLNETTGGIPYDYASRVAFGVSTAEEVGRLFGPGEALISYFAHGDTVTAFVIVRGELHVRRIEAAASEIAARLERFLATLRAAPKPGTEGAWQVEARALHGALLAPVMPLLGERIDALFVSPHGFLANVPFSLLVDTRGQPVLETARVTYVPSASIYRQLLSRPILNRAPRLLAVGNAIYPDGIESLDFAELEAVTVAELFPGGRLLRGSAATEARVTDLAPRYNILHFATHGVLLGKVVPGASSLRHPRRVSQRRRDRAARPVELLHRRAQRVRDLGLREHRAIDRPRDADQRVPLGGSAERARYVVAGRRRDDHAADARLLPAVPGGRSGRGVATRPARAARRARVRASLLLGCVRAVRVGQVGSISPSRA